MMRKWITLGTMIVVLGAVGLVIALEHPDLIGTHQEAASAPSSLCVGCHGAKTSGSVDVSTGIEETSLDPKISTFHAKHLDNELLKLECTTCHSSVDLVQGSAAHLRKQVSTNICLTCHDSLFAPSPAEPTVVATLPAGFSEFSLPYAYGDVDAAAVLGVQPGRLRLASASGAVDASSFRRYPEAPANQITPGVGYQITLDEPVSITTPGDVVTQSMTRVLADSGWNLISSPYLQSLRWDQVRIQTTAGEILSVEQAERAGLIAKVLWIYDAQANDYQTTDTLEPFKAYWVQVFEDVTLLIPRPL